MKYTLPDGADGGAITGKFKLDETAKPHKSVDWIESKGLEGQNFPDLPAIYAFEDGETLKICNPLVGHPRPTVFFEATNSNVGTVVFKRQPR